MKINKKAIISIIVGILVVVAVWRGQALIAKMGEEKVIPVNKKITTVQVGQAVAKEEVVSRKYDASLEPYEVALISPRIAGKVERILFENNAKVKVGQVLAVLDDRDLANQMKTLEANRKRIEISIESSKKNYLRLKGLYEEGLIPIADLEAVETSYQIAETELNSLNVNRDILSQTMVDTQVKATISGVIDEKQVNLGQVITPNHVIAKVKDVSKIYAVVKFKQEDFDLIKVGQKALFTMEGKDKALEGKVAIIDLAADSSNRVFTCKILLDNPKGEIRPGTFGKVKIFTNKKSQGMYVPIEAIVGSEGNYGVFVNEGGKAVRKKVAIGNIDGKNVEITEGIKAEDKIILTNLNTLQDGDSITVEGN